MKDSSYTPASVKGFAASIRSAHWWQYKAAPLLGFVYVFIRTGHIEFATACIGIAMSVATILGIAGFGYVINDLYDIEFDKAVGKANRIGSLNKFQLTGLIVLLLSAALLPWFWLPFNHITLVLIVFQFSLYLLYSHPFIRFKEKHFFGAVCDALYGHAVPAIIAMYTFYQLSGKLAGFIHFRLFMCLSFVWLFTKGIRNIIIHQLEDRKNDRITHLNTFVLWYGPLRSLNLLNQVIIPVELLLLGIWLTVLSINLVAFAMVLSLFLLVTYLRFSGWNLAYQPSRQLRFKFLYFLNDLYEDWLPLLAVLLLPIGDAKMLVFVVLHLMLFPGLVFRLAGNATTIIKNVHQGRLSEQQRIIIK